MVIKSATSSIVVAQFVSPISTASASGNKMSALKWLHLRMIFGIATNAKDPCNMDGTSCGIIPPRGTVITCPLPLVRHDHLPPGFHGRVDLLRVSIPLYNFVPRDRLVNPGENLSYPAGRGGGIFELPHRSRTTLEIA